MWEETNYSGWGSWRWRKNSVSKRVSDSLIRSPYRRTYVG
ncbi:hypothetical protein NPIL_96431, partial [Nephila pilipes]